MGFGITFAPLVPPTCCGRRSRVAIVLAALLAFARSRGWAGARAGAGDDGAGAGQSVVHPRGPRAAVLGGRGGGRQEPEPEFRRPPEADRDRARACWPNGSAAFPVSTCASSKPAKPTARPTARGCSRRSTPRSPTCRPTASPARSCSPTAACTTCRPRSRRSASTRRCMR